MNSWGSYISYGSMKGKEALKRKASVVSVPRKRAKSLRQVRPVLPEWVIGSYDGPKEKDLSLKEGYSH